MRAIAIVVLAVLAVGCRVDSPVFTPKPNAYPCHRQDGSADPWAVSCRPYDGTHTCCPERHSCRPDNECEYDGSSDPYGPMIGASRFTKRLPEMP